MFGKCESYNFMSWALHKTVTRNKSNCPVKVMISLDGMFAINVCMILRYTKKRTLHSFRVRNNTVAVKNFSCGEMLGTLSSFHMRKTVANARAGYMPSDPGSLSSYTYMGTRHVERKV